MGRITATGGVERAGRRRAPMIVAALAAALVVSGGLVAASGTLDDSGHSASRTSSDGIPSATTAAAARSKADVGVLEAPLPADAATAAGGDGLSSNGAETAAPPPTAAASGGGAAFAVTPTGSKVIKNAYVQISVAKDGFQNAFAAASRVASAHGGFVVSSSTSTGGEPVPIPVEGDNGGVAALPTRPPRGRVDSGQLVLRVPADQFDAARADLAKLGTVDGESITGQDVTAQLVDLGARITSLQAQEDAFRTLLTKASGIGDILQIQTQLFDVRTQIEQLQAQQSQLNDQAAMSTITAAIYEPAAAIEAQPDSTGEKTTLAKAWDRAAGATLDVLAGMVVVLGYAVPLAGLLLVAGLILVPVLRRRRRQADGEGAVLVGPPAPPAPAATL